MLVGMQLIMKKIMSEDMYGMMQTMMDSRFKEMTTEDRISS